MFGTSPFSRGSVQESAPLSAVLATRACASAKAGFCVSGSESELTFTKRDTISTPAEMKTSPSPALMACMAIRVVCSDDEQYRVTVVPGRWSMPSSTLTTRPMLYPCSPPGRPQPSMRSSMSVGSSAGTLSSAARTIVAARSSGRKSFSDPLNARPMGERAVATMTASGMGPPAELGSGSGAGGRDHPRNYSRVSRRTPATPSAADRGLLGLLRGGQLRGATAAQQRPGPARTGLGAAHRGGLHLGARPARRARGRLGDRADRVAAQGAQASVGGGGPDADRVGDRPQQHSRRRGVTGGAGVELVAAEQRPVGGEARPE